MEGSSPIPAMMHRNLFFGPIPLASLILAFLGSYSQSLLAAERSCNSLTFSGNSEYPPILWRDPDNPDKLTGVVVEVLEMALSPININLNAQYVGPWSRAQKKAQKGEIDGLAGAFFTIQRTSYLDYIEPALMQIPSVVFVREGSRAQDHTRGSLTHWDQLKPLRGVTLINNSFGQEFDTYAKQELNIHTVRSVTLAFNTLLAGRSDYLVYELQPGLAYSDAMGITAKVRHLYPHVNSEALHITMAKRSPCNTTEIKEHIATFLNNHMDPETIDRITLKYRHKWQEQVNGLATTKNES
ncbi:transporter substrate-binding domain-containing protein [Aestuariirhabdus sp. Z084]|uniref:substrate-binding periplasmic protein n=1 Tax=Aestuariirhabdus haliotis TaxID=2918751 RepID=UPI00201B4444|nr:transporter substrate-binding domain-containing protein [Aestuariirhabdus haliotis]MCL6416370.1 transporter substrate-binding domain-containing protein [Aestuariirhabdus haliotis]MCL6420359.1 transporter substrate-binding domain-containing protein [Aestuariirhabdus haliotis]